MNRRRRIFRRNRRRGSVLVEVAVTVPILFAVFGFIWEFSRAEMIRQTAATAAHEGARQGMITGGTSAMATSAAQDILDAVGIRNATIVLNPTTIVPDDTVRPSDDHRSAG